MFQNLSTQKKGSLLAFVAVMFITPDSLLIRLSNVNGGLYAGIIIIGIIIEIKN